MIRSRKSLEGEVIIDHRYSPGLSEETSSIVPPHLRTTKFEAPFFTCNHCQGCVVISDARTGKIRERPPNVCTGCSRYICDGCLYKMKHLGEPCKTFDQIADEICAKAEKELKIGEI